MAKTSFTRAASKGRSQGHGGGKREKLARPYQIVTDRLLALMENGTVPWRQPWGTSGSLGAPANLVSGKGYRGVNVFLLTCLAHAHGYSDNLWLTYRQASERGGHVVKGEKSTPVVFWKILEVEGREDSGEQKQGRSAQSAGGEKEVGTKRVPMLKSYNVFNVAQCRGIDVPQRDDTSPKREHDPVISCESVLAQMPSKPSIVYRGRKAFYDLRRDVVTVPRAEDFENAQGFYATLFHELVHASGHESRLNRASVVDAAVFGSPTYAREELVAEMGSAFLCAHTGIDVPPLMENAAAYLSGWTKALREDERAAVVAASQAQRAADYLLRREP